MGEANSIAHVEGAGSSRPANIRPAAYMPCAIAPGIPSALAVMLDRWIGFLSPDTAASRRPMSAGSFHSPVTGGGWNFGRSGRAGFSEPGSLTDRERQMTIDCHNNLSVT